MRGDYAKKDYAVTFFRAFWVFMIFNVLGVFLEGFWCLYDNHVWQTHVVTMWGPFCLIYGIGVLIFYILGAALYTRRIMVQFVFGAAAATAFEYLCGTLLAKGLGMYAWTYKMYRFNIQGRICLEVSCLWGILSILFTRYGIIFFNRFLSHYENDFTRKVTAALAIFMAVNILFTAVCIYRWSQRHWGIDLQTSNPIMLYIDKTYPDDYMHARFMEWRFFETRDACL